MQFSDLVLSQRLERAEGHACLRFAEARLRLFPGSRAEWIECGGAYAVFDGVDSPITQSFGLGIFQPLSPDILDQIERFFLERGAPVLHEVSPFAGTAALNLLCSRDYTPIEISSVLYQPVVQPASESEAQIQVRIVASDEFQIWTDVSASGWTHEHPELRGFFQHVGVISSAREHAVCFLAEVDGQPGAAGVLCLDDGVALFGGAATVPELRRRGLQTALLRERMRYAFDHGCDLAIMVTETGSASQRNAERRGFRVAYTRMKWKLCNKPSAPGSRPSFGG